MKTVKVVCVVFIVLVILLSLFGYYNLRDRNLGYHVALTIENREPPIIWSPGLM